MVYCFSIPLTALFSFFVAAVFNVIRPDSGISLSSMWLEGPSFQEDTLAFGVAIHIDTIDVTLNADVHPDDPMAWVVTDAVDTGIVETVAPGPKDVVPMVEPASFTSIALSAVKASPNVKTVPKVVQVAPTLAMVTTIRHTPQPSGTSIASAQLQAPFLVARSNPQDRFFNKLVIVVSPALAVAMGVLVFLSLDSGVPPVVLDFLLLFFRALREEAAIEAVVGIVSLVWRLLFNKDEVSEANLPTAEQEVHGADSSLGLDHQLKNDTASGNVAYGNERLQAIIKKSIGSKLHIRWDKEIPSAVENVVFNHISASGSIPSTVNLSASHNNLRAFASMAFFSSVNNIGEESVIESVPQVVSTTILAEDSVNDSQAEVTRTSALSVLPAISDLDVATLARTGTDVAQGTVELEGTRRSLFSSGNSETGNYLLSLPETYIPVRVDGFYALQQEIDNMSFMHPSASYSFDPVPRVATSGSSSEQAVVDDDPQPQTAVAQASSPSLTRQRKSSYTPHLKEAHTPVATRASPSRKPIRPSKPISRTGAKAPMVNTSVHPSPSEHSKDRRSSPPALKTQKQKEICPSSRRYGHHTEGAARASPPRPSNPVLRSTSSGRSLEEGSFRTPARAAAFPTRNSASSHVRTGQPRRLESTSSRLPRPKQRIPSRFPVQAPTTRPQEESDPCASPSRARRCHGLGCS
ncbi:hypothetical protein IW261DRAFT_357272 [Armillaria novae-zelandiae]|uniref:Uncharacterized protein n=1 Tax=Armillaria novae-zelandiae TaxID=153914 RepID=A0AA39UGL5_9AGAR|nr:hypothetical protein IW261DRAFT_357272 [Armillaria novae-zelandiae]